MIEADAEKFIKEKLGLSAKETKNASAKKEIEQCPADSGTLKIANLKQP